MTAAIRSSTPPGQPGTGINRASHATAIEQTRAAAEVYAAVMVARELPRNRARAEADMRESTARRALAERAFFRYSRGDGNVTGPTVQLARELARCWGNIQYEVTELRRDDANHESEMLAWAWDLETNTRSAIGFVVPHIRDTKSGRKTLVDVRDVYENNANMGARRLRECIFSVLPGYYVEEAKERCQATLEKDTDGKTLSQQITDVIDYYARNLGIVTDQLEQKLGRKSNDWTPLDVAQLGIVVRAIRGGETTKDEEFPPARITGAEIQAQSIAAAEAAARARGADFIAGERAHLAAADLPTARRAQPDQPSAPATVDDKAAPEPLPTNAVRAESGEQGTDTVDPGSVEARDAERRAAGFKAEQTRRRNARTAPREPAQGDAAPPEKAETEAWPDVPQPPDNPAAGTTRGGRGTTDDLPVEDEPEGYDQ